MIFEIDNSSTMLDCLNYVDSFYCFNNGLKNEINKNDIEYSKILTRLEQLFNNSMVLPAFGVSLHNETLNEIKKDCWLQINFNKELIKNGLNFNSLLFKLEETSGINLIRLYNNKYDGRCIYLNLEEEINLKDIIM